MNEFQTARIQGYPEYKDTSISWLGKIPAHWKLFPGRAIYSFHKNPNQRMKENQVLSLSYGKIRARGEDELHGLVPESFETYQVIEPGDIICRPTDLQNDWNSLRFGISRNKGIITSAYFCIRTKHGANNLYAHRLLHSYDLKKVFYGLGSGLRQNLSWEDFKQLPCPTPPLGEQAAIVRYLDNAEEKIQAYISTKEKLIALLEEQRQAIIHQAVTRGLDPNVKLKPSGVEWLGDVPEHWEVRRLQSVAEMKVSNVDKHTNEDEVPIRLCNYVDVYKNEQITNDLDFMPATASQSEIERFRLETDDVLITKDSETWDDIGVPAIVTDPAEDLICGYHLAMLRPAPRTFGPYLFRSLQATTVASQFHIEAKGVTRYGLTHNAIQSVRVPFPPFNEQRAIADHINRATAALKDATSQAHRQIKLMEEYRTRLIADVVTGKLDVR